DGGFMDHVRVKVFPPLTDRDGHSIKYLQPRGAPPRLYFVATCMRSTLEGIDPLYLVEGEKKTVSVAQLGLPAVGIAGVEGWHHRGERDLLPDFDAIALHRRVVNVIPDADSRTNSAVAAAVRRLGTALAVRGAIPRLVCVPDGFKGIDDWL